MEQATLEQRFKALETANAERLKIVNAAIKRERENKQGDKDKIDFLKSKRKGIFITLNLVRVKLQSGDLNYVDYNSIRNEYVAFQSGV